MVPDCRGPTIIAGLATMREIRYPADNELEHILDTCFRLSSRYCLMILASPVRWARPARAEARLQDSRQTCFEFWPQRVRA